MVDRLVGAVFEAEDVVTFADSLTGDRFDEVRFSVYDRTADRTVLSAFRAVLG